MTYDEYTGCPGCGEYEDRHCRSTGEDYERLRDEAITYDRLRDEARERFRERITWKLGDVQLVEPDRRAYDGAPGTSDFEWWPDGLLDDEPPPQGFVARLRAQSAINHACICKDKDKPDLGCPKHGVQIIRLSENSIFAVWGDRPPPRYQE